MSSILQCIFLVALFVIGSIFYVFLMKSVFPLILKLQYRGIKLHDRGLKKYRYEEGRAVTYEPAPSMRKYISQYALFTDRGYKYICCKTDSAVRYLSYHVAMFDNRNRVIDTIEVTEQLRSIGKTAPVMLHSDTSYVHLNLISVNDVEFDSSFPLYCRWYRVALYLLLNVLLTLAEIVLVTFAIYGIFAAFGAQTVFNSVMLSYLVLPSLLIGGAVFAIVLRAYYKKGVRVI
ncbi:MAG: hypothetical protein E7643_02185 [Ruminococcaceae bacterium]|nr:hypothetical protein [Oscillospiraceae bacterium]